MSALALVLGIWLLPDVWTGGCEVDYKVTATARPFARAIPHALHQITETTGIRFVPVRSGQDLTFTMYPRQNIPVNGVPQGVIGLYDPQEHTVWLTDVAPLLRRYLAMHETMHFLGAAHSESGNVMDGGPVATQSFGADDLATLNYIAIQNGCDPNE